MPPPGATGPPSPGFGRGITGVPPMSAPQDRPLRGQAGGSQGSGRWRHGTGRRRGRRVRKRSSGRIPYEEPNKLGFPPFRLGCPILFRGRERGDRRDRTLFSGKGRGSWPKGAQAGPGGKDTRRGAEKRETGGCLWAAAGFSHRGVGGLALSPVPGHCVPWAWAPLLFFFCRACFWSCWLFLGIKSHLSSSIAWEKRSIPEKQPNCKKTQKDFRYSS